MKFAKIALVVGMGLAGLNIAHAADEGHGTITFTGSIIDAPCSITPDTIDQTVNLGQVANAALANKGTSTPIPFNIDLENCVLDATGNKVAVTFSGMADANDTTMLGLSGTATGAGIVIADQSGAPIELGTATDAMMLQDGSNSMQFSAWMQGDGASAVTPGDFQSVANFTLAYQ